MVSMLMGVIGSIAMAASGPKQMVPAATTTNPLHCVHVTDVGGRLVDGCYDVSSFIVQNGTLWAVCKLKGVLDGVDLDEDCLVPVTVGDCAGDVPIRLEGSGNFNCDCVLIRFGNCSVSNPRIAVDLNGTEQSCTTAVYPQQILCSIVNACASPIGNPRIVIASLMNQLL
jgi:hypothetical protein